MCLGTTGSVHMPVSLGAGCLLLSCVLPFTCADAYISVQAYLTLCAHVFILSPSRRVCFLSVLGAIVSLAEKS